MKIHHKQTQSKLRLYANFTFHNNTNNRPAQSYSKGSKNETKSSQNVLNEVWEGDGATAFYYSFVESENVYWKLVSCKKYFVSSFHWNYYEYEILFTSHRFCAH